jgi:hypothetical protein
MNKYSPLEYIKISVANAYGLGRENWDVRLDAFDSMWNSSNTDHFIETAKEPLLMQKGLRAYSDAINGIPTGYIMDLDATASGLQIMACFIGCPTTAKAVNLINTGNREDPYGAVAIEMDEERDFCKDPTMTHFYGSKAQPKKVFGEDTPELELFYDTLNKLLPGAMECMDDMQESWQHDALVNSWTLPDGHTASVKNMIAVDKPIEIDELNHSRFTHRLYENQAQDYGVSLAANIVHSVDAYVVREMYRMAKMQGFELLTIHDSFWASPNYMQNVRENYLKILIDIANSNILQGILRQITGNPNLEYVKVSKNLGELMVDAEYPLS